LDLAEVGAVQEEVAAPGAEGGTVSSSVFELAVSRVQPVTIELLEMQVVLTLFGTAAGVAGLSPAQGLGQAE